MAAVFDTSGGATAAHGGVSILIYSKINTRLNWGNCPRDLGSPCELSLNVIYIYITGHPSRHTVSIGKTTSTLTITYTQSKPQKGADYEQFSVVIANLHIFPTRT